MKLKGTLVGREYLNGIIDFDLELPAGWQLRYSRDHLMACYLSDKQKLRVFVRRRLNPAELTLKQMNKKLLEKQLLK